jgi:hypothetical protein
MIGSRDLVTGAGFFRAIPPEIIVRNNLFPGKEAVKGAR